MLTTHLHLVLRSKIELSYTSTPPIRLYGVVLSEKKAQEQLYVYHEDSVVQSVNMKSVSLETWMKSDNSALLSCILYALFYLFLG